MSNGSNRLIIPAFGGLYKGLHDFAELALRVVLGVNLIPHGAQKLFGGYAGTAEFLASIGFVPGGFWAAMIIFVEFFGGIALVIGLLTRPFALAVLVFMAVAVGFHWGNGFFWSDGGWEYPLMWAVLAFYFVVRGGGVYSADRLIGREF